MDIYHSKVGGDVSSTQDQVSPLISFMRESELWSHAKLAQISVFSHSFVSLSFSFLVDLIRKIVIVLVEHTWSRTRNSMAS